MAANYWPWPYYFIRYTSASVYANLDFFSQTAKGALFGQTGRVDMNPWGQLEGYLNVYAIFFALVPPTLVALYMVGKRC